MKIAYTAEEAAEMLSISERTLHTLRKNDNFPLAVMIGSKLKWTHLDLEQWVNGLPRVRMLPEPHQLVDSNKRMKAIENGVVEHAWVD